MKNIKIVIEYDGTNYCGWQRQDNAISVQQKIEEAIKKVTQESINITGCSRTDAGVHARGQVANFITASTIPADRVPYALNSRLPDDIVIKSAEEMPMQFHSRYNCTGKRYSYTILNSKIPSAILRNYTLFYHKDLDFNNMKNACKYFLGTHDFSAFKSTGSSVKTSTRTIKLIELTKNDNMIRLDIAGDGFLYNMVRIIVGTLLDIGRGRISYDSIEDIILSKDRTKAGHMVPPEGLCLEEIYY